jgi:hypothetical protein
MCQNTNLLQKNIHALFFSLFTFLFFFASNIRQEKEKHFEIDFVVTSVNSFFLKGFF